MHKAGQSSQMTSHGIDQVSCFSRPDVHGLVGISADDTQLTNVLLLYQGRRFRCKLENPRDANGGSDLRKALDRLALLIVALQAELSHLSRLRSDYGRMSAPGGLRPDSVQLWCICTIFFDFSLSLPVTLNLVGLYYCMGWYHAHGSGRSASVLLRILFQL